MSPEDFQSLRDSIENIGVQNPITLLDGMVLDGWHRYSAAVELDMICPEVDLDPETDPRDFVLAQNKARRHVTQAQLALATASVYEWMPEGNPQFSQLDTQYPVVKTTAELAQIAGVHSHTIKQAKAVQKNAAPEVIEAVKRGDMGLVKAAAIAKLPKEQQAAAINQPMPKPEPAPAPVEENAELEYTEIDALRDQVNELIAEIAKLKQLIPSEAESANQMIDDMQAELKSAREMTRVLTQARDRLQNENAELKRQCAYLKKQIKN